VTQYSPAAPLTTEPVAGTAVSRDLPAYLSTIGISAFLLFVLEMLAGRLVLPVFGGSPAVWTTSLCFFTGVVFLGYLYAHLAATRLRPARGAVLHLAFVALALVAALAAPADVASLRNESLPEAINVIIALAVVVGPVAIIFSTTIPLLSSWFGRSGRDPWWLYAVSNTAALLGLLAYPFVIEPLIPLSNQRVFLVAGFALYALLLAAVAIAGARSRWRATGARASDAQVIAQAPLSRRRMLRWLVAAMVPAGLLSASTTFLATDLISAPLLWIWPLGIYLASMTVAFSARGRRLLVPIERLVPTAATLLWIPFVLPVGWPVVVLLATEFGAFGVLATAIHGRLALDRPDERHLTAFYLVLSAGGVLATGLVALAAPLLFSTVLEYPILIAAATGLLALLARPESSGDAPGVQAILLGVGRRLVPYAVIAGVLYAIVATGSSSVVVGVIGGLLAVGALIVAGARTYGALAVLTTAAIAVFLVSVSSNPLLRIRTFFGVTEVRGAAEGDAHALFSGTTLHGLQFLDDRRDSPTTYYVEEGPVGDIFDLLRQRLPGSASIGIVGLGAGGLTAYAVAGDSVRFYEIDPAVIAIAAESRFFSYLADSPATIDIVKGDARLSLQAAPDDSYDLLFLDAFSSDTLPLHLVTKEAIELYDRVLRPGGVMVFNVSNRFYDLPGSVAATARARRARRDGARVWPNARGRGPVRGVAIVVGGGRDACRHRRVRGSRLDRSRRHRVGAH
jgi:SAM-dependent methyltransferase